MHFNKIIFCLIFGIMLAGWTLAGAQPVWVPLDGSSGPAQPNVTLISSNDTETILEVVITGFWVEEIPEGGETFHRIFYPEGTNVKEIGLPAVPMITEMISVPADAAVSVSITDYTEQTLQGYHVYPFQTPLVIGEEPIGFDYDASFYQGSDLYPPDAVSSDDPQIWRDLRIAPLKIFPVRFTPSANSLTIYKRMTVRLEYTPGGQKNLLPIGEYAISPSFHKAYQSTVLNYEPAPPDKSLKNAGYEYLILAESQYFTNLQPLINYRNSIGLTTQLVDIATVGSDTLTIKNYIENEYVTNRIGYVLLVGDHDVIPCHMFYSFLYDNTMMYEYSDFYYTVFDGYEDYMPELMIGRFSISNATELDNMVNKTITYESNPPQGDWLYKSLMASWKEPHFSNHQDFIINAEQTPTGIYRHYDLQFSAVLGSDAPSDQDLNYAIEGQHRVFSYYGHGNNAGWGRWSSHPDAYYNQSDVLALNNGQYTPLVLSLACSTNPVPKPDYVGFCETWMRMSQGAVAVRGSTTLEWTSTCPKFQKEFFSEMFDKPAETGIHLNLGEAIASVAVIMGTDYGFSGLRASHRNVWLCDPALEIIHCDASLGDSDNDGVADYCDNCPDIANVDQYDLDHDGIGYACDDCIDFDHDNFGDPGYPQNVCALDNCPGVYNPDQVDTDGDSQGDACDLCTDTDGDGYGDPGFAVNECPDDNCPDIPNPGQSDIDGDGIGDICDNCPDAANADQIDTDRDGLGDACDNCVYASNPDQADANNNGEGDVCDCYGHTSGSWVSIIDRGGEDAFYSVEPMSDGSYTVAGTGGIGLESEYTLMQLSYCGLPVWLEVYSSGPGYNAAQSVYETDDGGCIATGPRSYGFYSTGLTVRLDDQFNTIWASNFNGGGEVPGWLSTNVMPGDIYPVVGWAGGTYGSEDCHGYLAPFDHQIAIQMGTPIWGFGEYLAGADVYHDVVGSASNNFVVTGYQTTAEGQKQVMVLEVDNARTIIWKYEPPPPVGYDDIAYGIIRIEADVNGYLVTGTRTEIATGLSDYLVIRIDDSGNELWTQTYGSIGDDIGRRAHETTDGNYVVVGYSDFYNGAIDDNNGYVIKIDGNGNVLEQWWDNLPGEQKVYDIDVTNDGKYVISGESDGDMYLAKFSLSLGSPQLVSPFDFGTVFETPLIDWEDVPHCAYYEVVVDNDMYFGSIDRTMSSLTESEWQIDPALTTGTWWWKVRAHTPTGPGPWSQARHFTYLPPPEGDFWVDAMIGDDIEGSGSYDHPYATIGMAISQASTGDLIQVKPGIYTENIDFDGKGLVLNGFFGAGMTKLQPASPGISTITMISGEPAGTKVSGFTIQNGGDCYPVQINNGAEPLFAENIFHYNIRNVVGNNKAVIRTDISSPTFEDNLFTHNGGISCIGIWSGSAQIINNTFDYNTRGFLTISPTPSVAKNNIVTNSSEYGVYGSSWSEFDYNNLWNNNPDYANCSPGAHDITLDPQYIDDGNARYYLEYTSPCINAGDPASAYQDPDGTAADMGGLHAAYVPHQFATIQGAVTGGCGMTAIVYPGTYSENIEFSGCTSRLISYGGSDETIIQPGNQGLPIVKMNSCCGDSYSSVQGFTLNGATDANMVEIWGFRALIADNAFIDQDPVNPGSLGSCIKVIQATPYVTRNLFVNNQGWACFYVSSGETHFINNTLVDNKQGIWSLTGRGLNRNNIYKGCSGFAIWGECTDLDYNNMWYNAMNYQSSNPGPNNFTADPMLDAEYKLQEGSPSIDGGHPDQFYLDADGSRNDNGAFMYGNRWEYVEVPQDFPTIQQAIDVCLENGEVHVATGTFRENINFNGKTIRVIGAGNTLEGDTTFLKPYVADDPTVLIVNGEGTGTELSGFAIIDGGDTYTVTIGNNASPLIANNIFRDNIICSGIDDPIEDPIFDKLIIPEEPISNDLPDDPGGSTPDCGYNKVIIKCQAPSGTPVIQNNLFYDNGGISCVGIWTSAYAEIINNTFDNNPRGFLSISTNGGIAKNNIVTNSAEYGIHGTFTVLDYNDVWNNNPDYSGAAIAGPNSISADPLYTDAAHGVYYLLTGSPCIGAGENADDMGAFPYVPGSPPPIKVVDNMPRAYSLDQNHPNPFNPTTTVSYALPEPGQVRIMVYNILGQEVKKLIDDYSDAGYYEVTWDGCDNNGSQVASGIYFYQMRAGEFVQSKKMLMLK